VICLLQIVGWHEGRMTKPLQRLANRPFGRLVWLAPVALAVHEAEE